MPMLRLTYAELAERTGHNPEAREHWLGAAAGGSSAATTAGPGCWSRKLSWSYVHPDGRFARLEAERDVLREELGRARERAARAEGEAVALGDMLADLARRLELATDELRDLRRPWWRRWIG